MILTGYKIDSKNDSSITRIIVEKLVFIDSSQDALKCPHIKKECPHFSWSISKNNTLRISFNEPLCVWCGWVWKLLYHKILFLIYLSLYYRQCINITSLLLLLGCFWYSLCMYSMYISLIMCIVDIDVWLHAQ